LPRISGGSPLGAEKLLCGGEERDVKGRDSSTFLPTKGFLLKTTEEKGKSKKERRFSNF